MPGRGGFNSRIGFIMAAIGSAVGLGNLWRFPFLASTNGGATFLVIYVALLLVIGLPALIAELSMGRRTGRNVVDAFGHDGKHRIWEPAGFLALISSMLLLSYFSVIAGWALRYLGDALLSWTSPPDYFGGAHHAESYFLDISQGLDAVIAHILFMAITVAIVARGVSKGIERSNLIMMPILFATVLGLVIFANTQSGASAGLDFYLRPDFSEVKVSTISQAAGQTFFSIGLGIGTMLTYASYMDRKEDIQQTGYIVGFSDTGVAVLAGLMVFPLMFAFGLSGLVTNTGASTVGGLFIAVPTAFSSVGDSLGTFLAGFFFIMLTFAALSSAISLLEVPVAFLRDRWPGMSRLRASLLVGLPVYTFGLGSALDTDFLTQMDQLVSRVLLILGGFLLSIYVGWVRPDLMDEMEVGLASRWNLAGYFRPVIRYALPVLLGALTLLGILGWFTDIHLLEPDPGSLLDQLTR